MLNKGTLTASVFLYLKLAGSDLPFLPPKKGDLFLVPNGIRPVMQRTAIEVDFEELSSQENKQFQMNLIY